MAHVAKYKAPAVGHMMAHYRREGRVPELRENVDESRTHLNYCFHLERSEKDGRLHFVDGGFGADEVRHRIDTVQEKSGRKVRKDAVVMADMVVTAPPDLLRKDLVKFFQVSYWYLAHQVGRENMLGGFVHMDEKTPHMHIPFTPITTNKKGNLTFSYKTLCPRSFYQNLHKGLGDELEKRLGYRPSVELTDEQRQERVYVEHTDEIDTAREMYRKKVVEPAEAERDALKREARVLGDRVDALKEEKHGLETQVGELKAQVADLEDEVSWWEKRLQGFRDFWHSLVDALHFLAERWPEHGTGRGPLLDRFRALADNPIVGKPTQVERSKLTGSLLTERQEKHLYERAQKKAVAPTREAVDTLKRRIDEERGRGPTRPGRSR